MSKVQLKFDRTGKNYYTQPSPSFVRRVAISISFLALFIIVPTISFSQTSSSGHTTSMVYKFSVNDVINPEEANEIQMLLMSNDYISSCTFIDEADCFKLTSSKDLTYADLKNLLLEEGLILSDEVHLSDGTIYKKAERTRTHHNTTH